jgi:hypothetical protein
LPDYEKGGVEASVVSVCKDSLYCPLLVWKNASPELPELIATGRAPTYPVDL